MNDDPATEAPRTEAPSQQPDDRELQRAARLAIEDLRGRILIEQPWSELRGNILFRRQLGVRGVVSLWRHPILRPIVLGPSIAFFLDWAARQRTWGMPTWGLFAFTIFLGFLLYFMAEGFQRLNAHRHMLELRDSGLLSQLMVSGLRPSEVMMGLVYPYVIGDLLGIVAIMTNFAIWATPGSTLQIVLLVFIFLNLQSLFRLPVVMGTTLEQFLQRRTIVSVWAIMLGTGVPLMIWFTTWGVGFLLLIQLNAHDLLPSFLADTDMQILALLAFAWIVSGKIINWWHRREIISFIRRRGSIQHLMEEFLHGN